MLPGLVAVLVGAAAGLPLAGLLLLLLLLLRSLAGVQLVVAAVPYQVGALMVVATALLLPMLLLLWRLGRCWAPGPQAGAVLQVEGAGPLALGLMATVGAWALAGLAWLLHPLAALLVLLPLG